MVEEVTKQTKPEAIQAVQFTGGAANAIEVVDWVRQFLGYASWRGSYEFIQNPDGTGQQGWSEILTVGIGRRGSKTGTAVPTDWIAKNDQDEFEIISNTAFTNDYEPVPEPVV